MPRSRKKASKSTKRLAGYDTLFRNVARVIEDGRHAASRSVNSVMTASYWLIGRFVVEAEQAGESRAEYGQQLIDQLSVDLSARFGRGFGRTNLFQIRAFYLAHRKILHAPSAQSPAVGEPRKVQTASEQSSGVAELGAIAECFQLPWSHYVRLLAVKHLEARAFYEGEALRGGWTVRQLDRQIQSQFYERTALSKNKAAMLRKGLAAKPEDAVSPEEAIKEPYLLEFLDLRDEYSESDLEAALIAKLEAFLLELGGDFTFVGRQRRL